MQAPDSSINESDVPTHNLSYWEKGFLELCVGMSIAGLVIDGIKIALFFSVAPKAFTAKYRTPKILVVAIPTMLSIYTSVESSTMVHESQFDAVHIHLSWISLVIPVVVLLVWVMYASVEIRANRGLSLHQDPAGNPAQVPNAGIELQRVR